MDASTLKHAAGTVTERLGPVAETVTERLAPVAETVTEKLAPVAETVTERLGELGDAAYRLAALTPWVETPRSPAWRRWLPARSPYSPRSPPSGCGWRTASGRPPPTRRWKMRQWPPTRPAAASPPPLATDAARPKNRRRPSASAVGFWTINRCPAAGIRSRSACGNQDWTNSLPSTNRCARSRPRGR